jgi:negative regulator of flagellin synthesis FlgM
MNRLQGILNPEAGREAQNADQVQAKVQQRVQQQPPAAAVADTVSFSNQGRSIARIAEEVKEAPEVRQDLVARFKDAVEAGSYRVESQDLATRMVKDMLMESLL